jgi:hypothetical protein
MAFNAANVARAWSIPPGGAQSGAYQGDPTVPVIWDYNAGSDTIADVESSSTPYFPADPLLFRQGDLLRVTASDGKALYRVEGVKNSNSGAAGKFAIVKLADVSAFAGDYPLLIAGA